LKIQHTFGVELEDPVDVPERGEIRMAYRERDIRLDLSSSGRGLQQTLLVLAYMYANPGSILLLDEPDAHLEILRQRDIYQLLTDVALENGNQIIAASHSEVLLNEAASQDVVVAFVGKPHRINDRGSQLSKALRDIPWEDYYLAEATGWVLYLEGSTDLAILRAFARRLPHPQAEQALERPFVHYVGNQPVKVLEHFHGLREAVPSLKWIALFDRLEQGLPDGLGAGALVWRRREIENYLCHPDALLSYARGSAERDAPGPLFYASEAARRVEVMEEVVRDLESAAAFDQRKPSPWSDQAKAKNCRTPWERAASTSSSSTFPMTKSTQRSPKSST